MDHLILKASSNSLPVTNGLGVGRAEKEGQKFCREYELLDSGVALRSGIFHIWCFDSNLLAFRFLCAVYTRRTNFKGTMNSV